MVLTRSRSKFEFYRSYNLFVWHLSSACQLRLLNEGKVQIDALRGLKPFQILFSLDLLTVHKDLCRIKAGFKSLPLQPYFEFRATFQHWLAQRFQNKIGPQLHLKPVFTLLRSLLQKQPDSASNSKRKKKQKYRLIHKLVNRWRTMSKAMFWIHLFPC